MGNKKGKAARNRRPEPVAGGFRRIVSMAAAVLLVLAAFFLLSDSQAARDLRSRIGIGSEQTDDISTEAPDDNDESPYTGGSAADISGDVLPEYNGSNYVSVAGGIPAFPEDAYVRAGLAGYEAGPGGEAGTVRDIEAAGELYTEGSRTDQIDGDKLTPYEFYGELDDLGRCTAAYGCLGEETMPAEGTERGDISGIHPSGWARAQGWERCHLIAWALSDENANERNLVTGTHYMNHDGMRLLEEEVEHYIWNTGNHVLYMSRPVFSGDELVPRGVQMSAWSCEDHGRGISFNVYCFNVTPGAEINYNNGVVTTAEQAAQEARMYVLNRRSGVFHYPSCDGAKSIYKKNRREVTATRKEMTDQGYIPCGYCEP